MAQLEKNCPWERNTLRSKDITMTAGAGELSLGKQNGSLAYSEKFGGAEFANTG